MRKTKETKKNRGITLISLIVTIIVLLILAGISIATLNGDSGIIKKSKEAKEQTEISEEKEVVDRATVQAMGNNKKGDLIESELQEQLDKIASGGKIEVSNNGEKFEILFRESNRCYTVDKKGNILEQQTIAKTEYAGDITKNGQYDGSAEKPYQISCIEDLVAFSIMTNGGNNELGLASRNFKDEYVILARTLNFNSIISYNDYNTLKYGDLNKDGVIENIKTELTKTGDNCVGFEPINNFEGNFDGKQNEIQNIYINRDEKAAFMIVSDFGILVRSIKNLGITGEITSKNSFSAGIFVSLSAGAKSADIIENCWNKANVKSISGVDVAGICTGSHMVIKNCYNEGNIVNEASKPGQAGGIIAGCGGDEIVNCYNTGNITALNGIWWLGGIASGHVNNKTTIKNSYNRGKIIGGKLASAGIIGCYGKDIENCYNIGDIIQGHSSGGIVGNTSDKIYNCYNAGTINGSTGVATDGITELSKTEIINNKSFVETLNNNRGTNTEWKKWVIGEDGYPTFE